MSIGLFYWEDLTVAREGKSKTQTATIEVPEQDVVLALESEDEVRAWFETQQAFWEKLESEVGGGITLANFNLGNAKPFFNKIKAVLNAAKSAVLSDNKTAFVEMVAYAQRLQLILADGSIAGAMQDARNAGRREEVLAFLYAYGQPFWPPGFRDRNFLMPMAAALVAGHPAGRLVAYSS